MHTTLVWFRQDLRLADHPALCEAVQRGAVVPVFIYAPDTHGTWSPGSARKWWLHQSLASLDTSLQKRGSRLILRQGDPLEQLLELAKTAKAETVMWNRRYEPALIDVDKRIKRGLADANINAESFNGRLLYEPWQVETQQGKPYQVFTPFHRTVQAMPEPSKPLDAPPGSAPGSAPGSFKSPYKWPASDKLDALGLMPRIKWYTGMAAHWDVSEAGAAKRLESFLDAAVADYQTDRDLPWTDGTSQMSPYLHHGQITPRQIYHATMKRIRTPGSPRSSGSSGGSSGATSGGGGGDKLKTNAYAYLREVIWREFGYHLLYHFPHTPDHPLREKYNNFPWLDHTKKDGRVALAAWQQGQTGYPLIDAGMRQLWHTGWMHNRVRMVVASFLVKHLLIHWHQGARWFWDTLVDADLANNTLGWQWAGGCGADAAPYFRIFNPMTQGQKFDPQGEYVRTWCPELKDVPDKYIHQPWECPPLELQAAGVTLGDNYPAPIVDHKQARERALGALSKITG